MNFLQFFVWGSWLISLGGYMSTQLGFSGLQIGSVYSTMGIASVFMPGLLGIVADRWINAERVFAVSHFISAGALIAATRVTDFQMFYSLMLVNSLFYMPTLALSNSVCYNVLTRKGYDVVKAFPPIRVWGTVGFIVAMWTVDFMGWTKSTFQLYQAAGAGIFLGCYAFTVPPSPPFLDETRKKSLASSLGLDAFVLFKHRDTALFFIFSLLLGAALQITNAFGGPFLDDFKTTYPDSFGVQHPNLLLSISQISETFFILLIPFFLTRFGIRNVILFSIFAWVLRFALFGLGNPDDKLYLLILSMIIYGMAFDFFNISGSLYVEKVAEPKIRSSAQGVFMIMTNGFGAIVGGYGSGWVVDHFTTEGIRDWPSIWFTFSGYALALAVLFLLVFRDKRIAVR
ncbi:MFS transporter, NHS family, xanthosine permease [Parapedobacter luteus]|uniref:MFS transporter, NHS family, xanthosine permease n=2 Tax=Sphingobacteriaceae TaxID=84566 RepID=A0A1T5B346_9SPHI|nr:MFS transporter, NHS family, xanthosine permease [Parapedobacter luteus]